MVTGTDGGGSSPRDSRRPPSLRLGTGCGAPGVRLAEARLRELADTCDISVYRYRMLPTWRLIRTDSTMLVSAFGAGWEGHESATYKVTETPHGPLYRGFLRMFQAIIDDAERTV